LLDELLPLPLNSGSDWSSIYDTTISNPIVVFVGLVVAVAVAISPAVVEVNVVVVFVTEEEGEEEPGMVLDGYMT
jgi:hypothetical protein